jgi:secreted trypsin-like serine protease
MKIEKSKRKKRSLSYMLFIVMLISTVFSQGVIPVSAQEETPTDGEVTAIIETPTIPVEDSTETATPEPVLEPTATATPGELPTEEVTPTQEATTEPTFESTTAPVCFPLTLRTTEDQGVLTAVTPQNCEGGYFEGTTVRLSANVTEGFVVTGWQGTINDTSTALLNVWIAGSNGLVVLLTGDGDASDQIIGGVQVNPVDKYPFIVAIVDNLAFDIYHGQFCGGSLIRADLVLTAAHCVYGLTRVDIDVVAGLGYLYEDSSSQRALVSRIYVHPKFNPNNYENDIAIIKLTTPFILGSAAIRNVQTIPLVSTAALPASATVAGWGAITTTNPYFPTELWEVSLPIMSTSTCNDVDHYRGKVSANMFCAGVDVGGYDACYGDDGGPLFYGDGAGGYNLAGIVSWGDECAKPKRPRVFTRVYNYLSWIATFTTNDDFDYATAITTVPSKTTQNTSGAYLNLEDPALTNCGLSNGDASVWYKYTPSVSRPITLDTLGSNYDTQMGVFTGKHRMLTPVACNDNVGGGLQSRVSFTANAGTTYYIVISQRWLNNPGGNMVLHASTFSDVDASAWYWPYIEGFYAQGITTGCGGTNPMVYCPDRSVTRAEMAVFLLRAKLGGTYVPPAGSGIFADIPVTGKEWMQDWVEKFYADGITTGCGASPLAFCPEREVTRAEMAVFILRAKYGSAYVPPATSTPIFTDVPVAGKEWMQAWIEQLYKEGITTGCSSSPMRYCPEQKVTRMEMAVFLSRAFGFSQIP